MQRTIKVKCATWDQVEAFYTTKVKGDRLVLRMPAQPPPDASVTVALVMPNGLTFALDGRVTRCGDRDDQGKYSVSMTLSGMNEDTRQRLQRVVKEGRSGTSPNLLSELAGLTLGREELPPPEPQDAPIQGTQGEPGEPVAPPRAPGAAGLEELLAEELPVYEELRALEQRHRELATHQVLDVAEGAPVAEVRRAYLKLTKKLHPDVYGRYHSPALRELASEVFLHVNRAYDRLRGALSREGDALPGPARAPEEGWLATGPEEGDGAAAPPRAEEVPFESAGDTAEAAASEPRAEVAAGAAAEARARAALEAGRWEEAREGFAEALRADPRSRSLRALYHVASGQELRARGRGPEAHLHFETALRHDKDCAEAQRALAPEDVPPEKKGLFRRLWGR